MGTGARPYLYMIAGGINGRNGPVLGVVDSGADMTCFPEGYAPLMGFSDDDLESLAASQAGGDATFRRAKHEIEMWLPEMPEVPARVAEANLHRGIDSPLGPRRFLQDLPRPDG